MSQRNERLFGDRQKIGINFPQGGVIVGCLERLYTLIQRHVKEIALDRPDYTKKEKRK